MVDAFIYMYFVGAGVALGVGTVAFIGWKVVKRSNNKQPRIKKKRGIV